MRTEEILIEAKSLFHDPTLVPLLKQIVEKHKYSDDRASSNLTLLALSNLGWYDEPDYLLSVATDQRVGEQTRGTALSHLAGFAHSQRVSDFFESVKDTKDSVLRSAAGHAAYVRSNARRILGLEIDQQIKALVDQSAYVHGALGQWAIRRLAALSELYPDQVARAMAEFEGVKQPGGGPPSRIHLEPLETTLARWAKFMSEDCRTVLAALQRGEDIAPLAKAIEQRKSAKALEQWKSAGSPSAPSGAGVQVESSDALGHIESTPQPGKQTGRLVMLLAGAIIGILLAYRVLRKVQRM